MFALGIRYLLGRAVATQWDSKHKAEWPPHPDRVYMALVAAHGETGESPAEAAALRWLEQLPCPGLAVALETALRESVTAYVPVNDTADPVLKGKPVVPMGTMLIGRIRQPRQFPTVVPADPSFHLIWPDATMPAEHRAPLEGLCAKVTYLGHSSSPVQMWVEDRPPAATLVPTEGRAAYRLRVFGPGRLDDLLERYHHQVDGEWLPRRPQPLLWQGYDRPGRQGDREEEVNEFAPDLIVLRQVIPEDGVVRRFGLESTLMLTQALRAALMRLWGAGVPEWLSGHRPDGDRSAQPHLGIVPLAFVGRQHADGHLLGLALVLPRTLPEEASGQLMGLLTDADAGASRTLVLRLGGAGRCELELDDRPEPMRPITLRGDTLVGWARRWATVTPIALDRFPRRQLSVEEVIADACVRAGLPRPAEVRVGHAPRLFGVPHSRSFPALPPRAGRPPRPLTHAVLRFDQAMHGPVLIGAARYVGYGLCRPCDDAV
jgi:CRISPR-associated protein Csb2